MKESSKIEAHHKLPQLLSHTLLARKKGVEPISEYMPRASTIPNKGKSNGTDPKTCCSTTVQVQHNRRERCKDPQEGVFISKSR